MKATYHLEVIRVPWGIQDVILGSPAAPGPQMGLGVEDLSDVLSEAIRVDTNAENVTKIPTPWTVSASSVDGASPTTGKPNVDSASLNSGNGEDSSTVGIKVQLLPESGGLWNLDRLDQRDLPLDDQYRYGNLQTDGTGNGVTIYVLDSGIRTSHREFLSWRDGRKRASFGEDFIGDFSASSAQQDCDGHGTHVASIAAGRSVGVAKEANVVGVRVLDCNGTGTISDTIAGLDWLAENVVTPAVAVLSLGVTTGQWSKVLENTVRAIVKERNVTVVVAAGNSKVDACNVAPANVGEVISVAASNLPTKFNKTTYTDKETVYSWTNYGSCIDIFAPGVDIYAACGGAGRCSQVNDSSYTWGSGTSMAAPHVAGVAAIYLADHPQATPAEVKAAIIAASTKDKIQSSVLKPGTPNRLLYSVIGGNELILAQAVSSFFGPPDSNGGRK